MQKSVARVPNLFHGGFLQTSAVLVFVASSGAWVVVKTGPLKMSDVARLANVSMSTVSRALADSPLIPEDRRREIQKIAEDSGYVINQSARSLRMRKTQTIGVVFPLGHDVGQLISDPFLIEMFGRLADEITTRGYQVLLCRVTETSQGWLDRIIQSQRQDGLVIVGQSDQHKALNQAAGAYSPIVVWGGHLPGQAYCSVGTDNVGGARRAVDHLVGLGRRKIAFLGMPELPEIGLRHEGYLRALSAAGIAHDPNLIVPAHFSFETAYEAARELIESGTQFDAIFAASDIIALAAIQALTAAGIDIPRDVSVVGFDDIAMAAQSTPPLTSVQQDLAKGARTIVDLLFRRMAGEDAPSATLSPSLIVRKSCGATGAK
jgi:DNA-binding LacI/PurR family transcriptional regulator